MIHSPLATPSATRAVLDEHGLTTKKSLGQHFLIDDNIVGRILSLADPAPSEVVLEVGPGIGTLTVALLARGADVVAVERDDDLLSVLADTTRPWADRFALVHADAVSVDVDGLHTVRGGMPTALVANLPYAVAATVVLRLFQELESLSAATVMVQAEVADRMAASPGTKDYGAYTVKLRLLARPAGRFSVPRTAFMPPPRVDSAVIRLERAPLSDDPGAIARASHVARSAFAQRRKTIRNSMRATLGVDGALIDQALERAGVAPTARGETLSPETYLLLADELYRIGAFGR